MPTAAGVVFSLCAAKAHLFLLTPVWLVARKDWDFAKGLLYGGAALFAFSTAVAGWSWPVEMWREAMNPAFTPSPEAMLNLHGALFGMRAAVLWELLLSGGVVWAVWALSRGGSFQLGFAVCLVGSMLLARHNYIQDLVLAIPALLIVFRETTVWALRVAAVALLAPPLMFFTAQGSPHSALTVGVLWTVLICWAIERSFLRRPLEEAAV